MDFLPGSDEALRRDETLAVLPVVLGFARRAVMATFPPGDTEADALRELLDECVVGAHRLALRERICVLDGSSAAGSEG